MEKMITALDAACYFLKLDVNKDVFTSNLVQRNGRTFYDGNAKLNKFLQLAQNIFIAKYQRPLFEDSFYAYDNGAVIPSIQTKYIYLLSKRGQQDITSLGSEVAVFLRKIFDIFSEASLDELIDLSHEDEAWQEKCLYYKKEDQIMDTMSKIDVYKEQYADIVTVIDRME